jgi:hypothetical protein
VTLLRRNIDKACPTSILPATHSNVGLDSSRARSLSRQAQGREGRRRGRAGADPEGAEGGDGAAADPIHLPGTPHHPLSPLHLPFLTCPAAQKHEFDIAASARKPPGTLRQRRTLMDPPPPTPLPVPSQIRAWSSAKPPLPAGARTPSRRSAPGTPSRRNSPRKAKGTSMLPPAPGPPRVPKSTDGALPGFVNAFAATPVRSPEALRRGAKGKGRAMAAPIAGSSQPRFGWAPEDDDGPLEQPDFVHGSAGVRGAPFAKRDSPPPSPPSSPTRGRRRAQSVMKREEEALPAPDWEAGLGGGDGGGWEAQELEQADVAMTPAKGEDEAGEWDAMSEGEEVEVVEGIVWRDEVSFALLLCTRCGS